MADPLVLYWGSTIVAAAAGRGPGRRVVPLAKPPEEKDPAAWGRWLKGQLGALSLAGKEVAIVLPRSGALMRRLTVPNVPDDELPDFVRMQAATKLSTPLERLKSDYVPLPAGSTTSHAPAGSGALAGSAVAGSAVAGGAVAGGTPAGREILLSTVPIELADRVLAIVRAANLEPVCLQLSSFTTANLLVEPETDAALLVAADGDIVEITIVRQGEVVYSHTSELHGDSPEEDTRTLVGEITRSVVAADHFSADRNLKQIVLIGSGTAGLADPLRERYGAEPQRILEPRQLPGAPEAETVSAAAAAACLGCGGKQRLPQLDFLHPRKRVEKPDHRKRYAVLAGAAATLLVAGAFGWSWLTQSQLDEEVTLLQEQGRELDGQIKRGAPVVAAETNIRGWVDERTDWAEEFARFGSSLPGTDRAYLTDLTLEPGSKGAAGHVRATGFAKTRADAEALAGGLAQEKYAVAPKEIVNTGRDPEYPVKYELDLMINKLAQQQNAARK